MTTKAERRDNPRLRLSYPIRVLRDQREEARPLAHTVTQNLSSRGAYFTTFHSAPYTEGRKVSVLISVPHRLATGGREVLLDMRGAGTVVRVEGPAAKGPYGEDGLPVSGIAIEFTKPLSFHYRWV